MTSLTRREFVRKTTLVAAAAQLASGLRSAETTAVGSTAPAPELGADLLRWLEGTPAIMPGTSWGRPWARGQHGRNTTFTLESIDGTAVPLQSWPLAFWPDGSLKWTAHAIPGDAPVSAG